MIRTAKQSDFQDILFIWKEVQLFHISKEPKIFKYKKNIIDLNTFGRILQDRNAILLVSEDQNKINGFLLGFFIEEESNLTLARKLFAIETIGVLKKEQNKKIGKKLMHTAKEIANHEKCDSIILNVWSFNEKAINFYKHFGFQEKSIKMELEL